MFEWYYVGQFGQLGPLSGEQMAELIESGVISRETYVWKRGMADWTLASSVPEFSQSLTPSTPPPLPSAGVPSYPAGGRADKTPPPVRGATQYSSSSRVLAGLLQLIPGVGRMYLGYAAIGVLQLVLAIFTCGIMTIWSWVDGILILAGAVQYDGYGRALAD